MAKQFNLYFEKSSSLRYQPDFIVETKDSRMLNHKTVLAKAKTCTEYCKSANDYNLQSGGKAWEYKLISHDKVRLKSSFKGIVITNAYVQEGLDFE